MATRLTTAQPVVGGYRFRSISSSMFAGTETFPHDPAYREITYLERPIPWLLHQAHPHFRTAILVEQRLR